MKTSTIPRFTPRRTQFKMALIPEFFVGVVRLFRNSNEFLRLKFVLGTLTLIFGQEMPAHCTENFTVETAQRASEKGNAEALYFLGKSYSKGNGVPQDYVKSAAYLRQAAERGFAFAQNDLGALYAKGLGVQQDYKEAALWYRRAADNGDSLAQFSMGLICYEGRGVSQDLPQSLSWYVKAAEKEHSGAMLELGDIYMRGNDSIPRDRKQALKWFRKAEKIGRSEALNSIGFILEQGGDGVDQDIFQAIEHYRQAAEKGDAKGQMNLGRMYQEGAGLKRDFVEAYKWFLLATQRGNKVADHYLMELEGHNPIGKDFLSSEQIAKAKHLAEVWSEVHKTAN